MLFVFKALLCQVLRVFAFVSGELPPADGVDLYPGGAVEEMTGLSAGAVPAIIVRNVSVWTEMWISLVG